jgi:chemotaxis protein CheX
MKCLPEEDFNMNVKFLLPFVEAAYEVLLAETNTELHRGELSLDKAAYQTDDITVIIALVGAVQGTVFYSMTQGTGCKLASKMMGDEQTEFGALAQSGIAELGNVITGRASVLLSQAGFEVTISPPALILGKGAVISTLDFPRLVVPLDGECGRVLIHLALRENSNANVKTPDIQVPNRPSI